MPSILDLLGLEPSPASRDYIDQKTQFHLHSLLTEQRHENTWDLGFTIGADIEGGLRAILSVDDDLEQKIEELAGDPTQLESAVEAMVEALRDGRRIYVYGCGATGRLAKLVESAFWRPFWRRVFASDYGPHLADRLPAGIADALVGEMTGADRALVVSLEGFEDLMQLGELQLHDHGIVRGDVVICVTEGGETSSVIGTILAALSQYGPLDDERRAEARRRLYFIYNNPDEVLRPFERSRRVLDESAITRINLATGPQAIAGSTRMQATTIETFVVGVFLEEALFRLLREHLESGELAALGFDGDPGIAGRLAGFGPLRAAVADAAPALARLTERESVTYESSGYATYFARAAMVTVFTDCTERSPTFRLLPLDQVDAAQRGSWVQVWTEGDDAGAAWRSFLGRPFRGLDPARYRGPLEDVPDPYLRRAALASLAQAGDDQELCYDFSLSSTNLESRGPGAGDLGVVVLVDEERDALAAQESSVHRFVAACRERGAGLAIVHVGTAAQPDGTPVGTPDGAIEVAIALPGGGDPLALRRQIALKILLNAHSTAIMARLGRVVGNTMTNVSPSNLKLVGRATFLIQTHVNDTVSRSEWRALHASSEPIDFAEANAVLFDAIDWVRGNDVGQTAEVGLSIVCILETMAQGAPVTWDDARRILEREGLAGFVARHGGMTA